MDAGCQRAACLGTACAAQQLPWFLVPFLPAGIYAARRGEPGARPATGVVLRIAGTTAAVCLLINTYFVVSEPRTWAAGDDSALAPHFTLTTGQGTTRWWKVVQGPAVLPAHASAVHRLRPPGPVFRVGRRPGTRIRLRVFTASPDTLSSMDIRLPGARPSK
ncbi:hypothetical protein RB628_14955 [Streptomyces sp. ADMS]|uniref:hypothetical protein n=1 Tax=Streptomyces sp. ADMS TaxID=3071415 RepID=UPI00296F35FB|nr:hypothetical protein [Streptomyces sp. ADMS]MDW4906601.1 hypothetical protein [Streptomyces sp. ADMS]